MGKDWHPTWNQTAGVWSVDFYIQGHRFRRRLGIRDKGSKGLATRAASAFHKQCWDQILNPVEPARPGVPFYIAAKGYSDDGGEARFLPKLIQHFGPATTIDDIDETAIRAAAQTIYPTAAPDTIRRQVHVPINAVIRWQRGERRRPSTDVRRTRWLTPEEAERLLTAAAALTMPRHNAPEPHTLAKIAFLIGSGARPGECLAADVSDWHAPTRQWWMPATETGAGKTQLAARMIRLPWRSVQMIAPALPDVGRAFLTPYGKPYVLRRNGGGQMATAFAKARDAAGLGRDVTPYTLRHTWATWHYAQTKDFGGLLDLGGWAKADMANRYRKIAPDDLAQRLYDHGWDFRQNTDNSPIAQNISVYNKWVKGS